MSYGNPQTLVSFMLVCVGLFFWVSFSGKYSYLLPGMYEPSCQHSGIRQEKEGWVEVVYRLLGSFPFISVLTPVVPSQPAVLPPGAPVIPVLKNASRPLLK